MGLQRVITFIVSFHYQTVQKNVHHESKAMSSNSPKPKTFSIYKDINIQASSKSSQILSAVVLLRSTEQDFLQLKNELVKLIISRYKEIFNSADT